MTGYYVTLKYPGKTEKRDRLKIVCYLNRPLPIFRPFPSLPTILSLTLVIVVTKSAPDRLKTELRLHVVVHVIAMNP